MRSRALLKQVDVVKVFIEQILTELFKIMGRTGEAIFLAYILFKLILGVFMKH